MNNVTYKINKLEVIPSYNQFVNVVKTIHYSAVIRDSGYSGYSAEIIDTVNLGEPISFQFIAYDDLPESTVIDWVKSKVDTQKIENILKQKLAYIKNPTVLRDPPWSN
jgi:hypothetical protein